MVETKIGSADRGEEVPRGSSIVGRFRTVEAYLDPVSNQTIPESIALKVEPGQRQQDIVGVTASL